MDDKIYQKYLQATGRAAAPTEQETQVEEEVQEVQEETATDVVEEVAAETVKTEEEKPAEQEAAAAPEIDYDAILREKLGDETISWDSLKDKLTAKPSVEFSDEDSRSLYMAIQEKKLDEVKKYLEYQTTDFDALDSDEVVIRYLREKKGWEAEKINDYLTTKFMVGQDENDEMLDDDQRKAIKRAEFEFEDFADEARSFFREKKKEVKLPEYEIPQPAVEDNGDKYSFEEAIEKYNKEVVEVENEKMIQYWNNTVETGLKDYDKSRKIDIKLGDGENEDVFTTTYQMSDKDMQTLSGYLQGYVLTEYDRQFVSGEGDNIKVDVKALADDVAFRLFGKKILKSALKEYAAGKMEDFVEKGLKNSDYSPKSNGATTGETLHWARKFIRSNK